MSFAYPVDEPLRRGSIRASDVARLERAIEATGGANREAAELLLALDDACPVKDPSWNRMLVDTIAVHLVDGSNPRGYVTAVEADWLLNLLCPAGHAEARIAIELLVSVMERARWAPVSLVTATLREVHRAVATGEGPLRAASPGEAGTISDAEVALIQRALRAYAGEGAIALTREETEVLLEIAGELGGSRASPRWQELFAKAMTNAVLASSGYRPPSRTQALAITGDAEHTSEDMPLKGVVISLSEVLPGYREQSLEERALARLEHQRRAIITAEHVSEVEPHWLSAALDRPGLASAAGLDVLRLLDATAMRVHPELQGLVARLGDAA